MYVGRSGFVMNKRDANMSVMWFVIVTQVFHRLGADDPEDMESFNSTDKGDAQPFLVGNVDR
jgi:hypothetical protein